MQTKKKNPVLLLLFAGLFYGSFITAQTYSLDSQAEEFYVNQIQRLDSICTVSDSDKKILREYCQTAPVQQIPVNAAENSGPHRYFADQALGYYSMH